MKRALCAALGALAFAVGAAHAQDKKVIGNWLVTSHEDRFSGGKTVVAMTAQDDGLFALRCLQQTLTFAVSLSGGDFKAGDLFQIKFRADDNPVADTSGDALSDVLVEVLITPDMRQQLLTSREFAFRITTPSGTSDDELFKVGRYGSSAMALAVSACAEKNAE